MFISPPLFLRNTTIAAAALYLSLSAPSAQAQSVDVLVPTEKVFIPQQLRITPGTEVIWTILGPHDVVQTTDDNCEALPGGFASAPPGPQTYSLVFDEPGTYYYMCSIHCSGAPDDQKGVIIVAEAEPGGDDGGGDDGGIGDDDGGTGDDGGGNGEDGSGSGGTASATGGASSTGGSTNATGGADPAGDDGDDGTEGSSESGCAYSSPSGALSLATFSPVVLLSLALLRRRRLTQS